MKTLIGVFHISASSDLDYTRVKSMTIAFRFLTAALHDCNGTIQRLPLRLPYLVRAGAVER